MPVANQVDTCIDQACREQNLAPLGQADELLIARRLTLSLHGRIPSLAEIRELEQSDDRTKLQEFADRLLRDRRFGEHVGEVLTRSIVTNDDYDFPNPYRRVSFHRWLSNELNRNTPYDKIVRRIVAEDGLCCEHGSTNFFTAFKCDPALLAAQTARSFLATRLDCAQCHNHPFAEWKQEQFHGLASYYSGVTQSKWQVYGEWRPYEYENHDKHVREQIAPKPPVRPDLDPGVGEPRARLAAWITHRENPYFARAIVNSMWAMLFGRGLVEPLDDLSKPQSVPGVLDLLANDLIAHEFDLKHLLRVIVTTQAFGRASSFDQPSTAEHESLYASFPLTRLRPNVTSLALSQTEVATPLAESANILNRAASTSQTDGFVRTLGTPDCSEVLVTQASLTQRLLLMNGDRVEETWGIGVVALSRQLALLCTSNEACVEAAYRACLSRRPTPTELAHFVAQLAGPHGVNRTDCVEDMMWCLTNSSEFQWHH